MRFNIFLNGLALILLAFSPCTFAINLPVPTACPLLDMVRNTYPQLDNAFLIEGDYQVITSHPAINYSMRDWFVSVVPVLAANPEQAISKAQEIVKTVFLAAQKPVYVSNLGYVCNYTAENHMTVQVDTFDNNISKHYL